MKTPKKDPDTAENVKLAHEIQQFMLSNYKNRWVSEKEMKYHTRQHNKVFNELVRRGFIERKKTFFGYQYRWKAAPP